jgi:uncharacterized membrane protein HdeD (DUF308 family)
VKKVPGWPLLVAAGVLIAVVAATVFKTPEIDNVIAWLFIGASLIFMGAWMAIVIHDHDGVLGSRAKDPVEDES